MDLWLSGGAIHFLKACNHYLCREQKHLSGAFAAHLPPAHVSLLRIFPVVWDSDKDTSIYLREASGLEYFRQFQKLCTEILNV